MKKLIALMLVIAFVFTLSACNDKNTASNPDTNVSTGSETFVKPENYASVLLVSINPQLKLYLDENNNVLAVEPVNEDAKSFSKSIDFKNKSIETVIGNIVEQANEKGFIKENVTVNFEIAEQKEEINNSDILSKAVSAANKKATELKIEIKAEIKESDNSQTTETNSENTQTDENSKPTTSSKTEETTKKEESASKPTTTTKPTESSKPTHTHNFSVATCTAPKKCSCGATEGTALGHKWSEATCKSPKTCSVCKKTEGNKINHKYDSNTGICSMCKTKDPEFKFKSISAGIWEFVYKDNFIVVIELDFGKRFSDCGGISISGFSREATAEDLNNPDLYIDEYKGKKYVSEFGDGDQWDSFEEKDNKVIAVYGGSYDLPKITLKRVANDTLIVESIDSEFPQAKYISVGDTFKLQ